MAAAKKTTKRGTKKAKKSRVRRSVEERISELRKKIQELEARKNVKELANDPSYKHFRAARRALEKAVEALDGRKSKFDGEFIRSSRQYLNVLNHTLEKLSGRKRRGRRPKLNL